MKFIKLLLSLLIIFWSVVAIAEPDNNQNLEKNELKVVHIITNSEYVNLSKELTKLQNENETLKNSIKLTDEKVNQSITGKTSFISYISWTTSIVLSFVGLLFGLFSFLMYRDNKKIIKESEQVLNEAKSLKLDFENWFKSRQEEYKKVIRNDYLNALTILQNTSKLEELKKILKGDKFDQKKIYPLVASLAINPSIEYKPYLNKIIELNISDEISEIARKGINKIIDE